MCDMCGCNKCDMCGCNKFDTDGTSVIYGNVTSHHKVLC